MEETKLLENDHESTLDSTISRPKSQPLSTTSGSCVSEGRTEGREGRGTKKEKSHVRKNIY